MNSISDKTKNYLDMLGQKFSKNNFCEFIKDLLNLNEENIVNGREQRATTQLYEDYIESAQLYAKYNDENRKSIGVIIIKLKNDKHPANARTLQRNYISHLMVDYYDNLDASLTAIYSDTDDSWRLSFVKQELTIEVGKLKTKVSPAKRYSYLFGKDEPNHTAKEQLLELLENNTKQYSVEEIENKFSVEKVTKDFFEKYKENYLALKENLESNKEFLSEASRCDFTAEEFTKKLMGQIVFIYFLQKKGWLGVRIVPSKLSIEDYNEIYNKESAIGKRILEQYYINFSGYKKIKTELLEHFKENESDLNTLSNIFANTKFDMPWGTGKRKFIRTLFENCKDRNKNFFDDYLEPFFYNGLNHQRDNQYFSVFNCKVPFLNGGLFEPLDNYNWETARFDINNDIFSNENETGILDFFDRYNFTMNEEEPLEKDVAVDPEMLGKIFENLLDVKDRKSKGAFYTPREIVHYMCQESLANFLVNKIGVDYKEIKEFIQYGEMIRDIDLKEATKNDYLVGKSIFENISRIDRALEHIKVADPSVGSGAFPLGMLNEIVKLRDILTSYMLIYNRLGLFDRIYTEEMITKKRNIYTIKWNTIKNCIYAVDIENSAVDITKLRLWLSIVVDQFQVPKTGPEPLPNLDCKIMQGNSLIYEFNGIKLIDEELIEKSKEEFVIKAEGKKNIENQMRFFDSAPEFAQLGFYTDEKRAIINSLIKTKNQLFGTNIADEKKRLLELIKGYREALFKVNFRSSGSNSLDELLKVDKGHNKPYFSWKLEFIEVFVENGGFDVVIGNPPYVKEYTDKSIFTNLKSSPYYEGKMDFWYFFGCYGIDLLRDGGIESYIAPNNWITNFGASKFRNKVLQETKIRRFIDFGNYKVFNTADIQTMVYVLEKNINIENSYNIIYSKLLKDNVSEDELRNYLYKDDFVANQTFTKYLYNIIPHKQYNNYIEFLDKNEKAIIDTILKCNNILYLNRKEIAQGIVCPQDSLNKKAVELLGNNFCVGDGVFVVSELELKMLNLNEKEMKYVKPYYTTEQIRKWNTDKNNKLYILYTTKEIENFIDDLPNLKLHFDKYKKIITSDNRPYGLHRARNEEIFKGEKIISVRKCQEPTFSYAGFDTYVSQTFNIIKTERINLKYLIGLLNSELIKYWLKYKGKMQGNNYQVDKEPLCEIPIVFDKMYANELINEVDNILTKNIMSEEKINNIVYKIYNIDDEKRKYIKENI